MDMIINKKPRYDGEVSKAAEAIKKSKADKATLIEMLDEIEQVSEQLAEVERLQETLPQEIDTLLKSGKMDEKTVENLARKRAHLDLLPARMEILTDREHQLLVGFEEVGAPLRDVIAAAEAVYVKEQIASATADLQKLGVTKDIAEQQAMLRADIKTINTYGVSCICIGSPSGILARHILWCFESLEAGLHPRSPEAEKIKQKWVKE
jgi:hypothetical protein